MPDFTVQDLLDQIHARIRAGQLSPDDPVAFRSSQPDDEVPTHPVNSVGVGAHSSLLNDRPRTLILSS